MMMMALAFQLHPTCAHMEFYGSPDRVPSDLILPIALLQYVQNQQIFSGRLLFALLHFLEIIV